MKRITTLALVALCTLVVGTTIALAQSVTDTSATQTTQSPPAPIGPPPVPDYTKGKPLVPQATCPDGGTGMIYQTGNARVYVYTPKTGPRFYSVETYQGDSYYMDGVATAMKSSEWYEKLKAASEALYLLETTNDLTESGCTTK